MGNDEQLTEQLREIWENQSWFKEHSNTVTSSIGAGINILWFSISTGIFDVPENVALWFNAAITVATVLGVYKTPNGITESQLNTVKEYVGKHRRPETR